MSTISLLNDYNKFDIVYLSLKEKFVYNFFIKPLESILGLLEKKLIIRYNKILVMLTGIITMIEKNEIQIATNDLKDIRRFKTMLLKNRELLASIDYFDNNELKEKVKQSYSLISKLERLIKREIYKDKTFNISDEEKQLSNALAEKSKEAINSVLLNEVS